MKGGGGEEAEGGGRGREGKQCTCTRSIHLGVRLNYIMEETDCASSACKETGYLNTVETG